MDVKTIIEEAYSITESFIEITEEQKRNAIQWMMWAADQKHMIGETVTFELAERYDNGIS